MAQCMKIMQQLSIVISSNNESENNLYSSVQLAKTQSVISISIWLAEYEKQLMATAGNGSKQWRKRSASAVASAYLSLAQLASAGNRSAQVMKANNQRNGSWQPAGVISVAWRSAKAKAGGVMASSKKEALAHLALAAHEINGC